MNEYVNMMKYSEHMMNTINIHLLHPPKNCMKPVYSPEELGSCVSGLGGECERMVLRVLLGLQARTACSAMAFNGVAMVKNRRKILGNHGKWMEKAIKKTIYFL